MGKTVFTKVDYDLNQLITDIELGEIDLEEIVASAVGRDWLFFGKSAGHSV